MTYTLKGLFLFVTFVSVMLFVYRSTEVKVIQSNLYQVKFLGVEIYTDLQVVKLSDLIPDNGN